MNIIIRSARPEEASELTGIAMRSKQSNGYDSDFMKACKAELQVTASDIELGDYWVAEGDKVCGFIAFEAGKESHIGQVANLFVDPPWQGQGIGSLLWKKIVEQAHLKKITKLQVDADPAAVAFYESKGFHIVQQVPSGSIAGRFIPRMESDI